MHDNKATKLLKKNAPPAIFNNGFAFFMAEYTFRCSSVLFVTTQFLKFAIAQERQRTMIAAFLYSKNFLLWILKWNLDVYSGWKRCRAKFIGEFWVKMFYSRDSKNIIIIKYETISNYAGLLHKIYKSQFIIINYSNLHLSLQNHDPNFNYSWN